MKIEIAKNSGFCFGVNNAINKVCELVDKGKAVYTLGDIIHNDQVIENLNKRGVKAVHSFSDIPRGSVLVIRSHGIDKPTFENIKSQNVNFVDATCPFVKRIHKIVENQPKEIEYLLLAGDCRHPETLGIKSYFKNKNFVFSSVEELEKIITDNFNFLSEKKGIMVSQTTFSIKIRRKCVEIIQKLFTDIKIYDTICNVTNLRQIGSEKLAIISDLMIVIGGRKSSNTKKLYEICSQHTKTIHIERVEEILTYDFTIYSSIGIVAGASTPMETVYQVKKYLETI